MPKETFWDSATAVEGDGSEPVLTVSWGEHDAGTFLNGVEFDASGIERLQNVLRRANGKDRNVTVTLTANTSDYIKSMEAASAATRAFAAEARRATKAKRKLAD